MSKPTDIWETSRKSVPAWAYEIDRAAEVQRLIYDAILAEREANALKAEATETPEDGEYWIACRIAASIREGR